VEQSDRQFCTNVVISEQNNGFDKQQKKTINFFKFKLLRKSSQSLSLASWLACLFSNVGARHSTALFLSLSLSLLPSSILPSTLDYPLNIMVSFVFSTAISHPANPSPHSILSSSPLTPPAPPVAKRPRPLLPILYGERRPPRCPRTWSPSCPW
jgi:hypothetical protein